MPTYDFRCPGGHEFEKFFRKISDAPAEVACPECGQVALRLVSGGAGLLFKGSGFYLTDYGKNAHRKGAAKDAKAPDAGAEKKSGESKSGDSGSESKAPSTASESKPAKPTKSSGSGDA